MTTNRYVEITQEAQRRINLWLEHTSFEHFTLNYSYTRFLMAIGFLGYPFELDEWMKKENFKRFVTDDEFEDPDFDKLCKFLWLNNIE